MDEKMVKRWFDGQDKVRAKFTAAHPGDYRAIVTEVVRVLADENEYESPDPKRVHQIDDGDYQGTLVFVIGAAGYQPSSYWYVRVSYGSCSGCDTLEALRGYSGEPPTTEQVDGYMTLALHVVQRMKKMDGEYV